MSKYKYSGLRWREPFPELFNSWLGNGGWREKENAMFLLDHRMMLICYKLLVFAV